MTFPDADALLAQAAAAAGLDDFGGGYRDGLEALVAAIRSDLPVTSENLPRIAGPVLALLISRLHSEAGWKQHPNCRAAPIRSPLVITGLPRTGTTALHNLLALDPQFQGLEQWLIGTPMPRPPRASWTANPHYQAAVAAQQAFLAAVPAMRVTHEVNSGDVDECLNLLAQSFVSHYPSSGLGLPAYDRWWWGRDESASYRRYADNLRLIGTGWPPRWLLKNPGHLTHLDRLLEVFPDACIVQTHRDPALAIPSVCGVIHPARCFFHARTVAATTVGPRELELWAYSEERATRVRAARPERFLDVRHTDFRRDPLGTVRGIYARFGLVLEPAIEARMQAWAARQSDVRQEQHRYTPEQFGLTRGQVRERFADYIARYDL